MTLNEFLKYVETRKSFKGDEVHQFMNKASGEARRMMFELNSSCHDPEGIRELLSRLLSKPVDLSFHVSLPFYTDFEKNIAVDKSVFISACCHFQGHGGVTLDDGCQIGYNVILTTFSHNFTLEDRNITCPAPIVLEKNVWVDSNATVLPGVTVDENAVVGTGSIVAKGVPDNAIAGGVPAKVMKYIQ